MLEYKINELFQWEDRTLMCVEWKDDSDCDTCKLKGERCRLMSCDTVEGIKLQIKRKGAKVKVKVLELSEEFDSIENDEFALYKANLYTSIYLHGLAVYEVGDKIIVYNGNKVEVYNEDEVELC